MLDAAVDELQPALGELRELAQGIHPAILTEDGLAAALESLADRTPSPSTVRPLAGRLPPRVEAAAYFVASEALANVAKHARRAAGRSAPRARTARSSSRSPTTASAARTDGGSGLRGLSDRVEALGGRLAIESPPGDGHDALQAEIPCGS